MASDPGTLKRRELAGLLAAGTLGAASGAGLLCAVPEARAGIPVVLGPVSTFAPGSARAFPAWQVMVVRWPEGLAVVRTRCTHLGCSLTVSAHELVCPCHGGRFTLQGRVKSGPPPRDLAWVHAGVDARGQLWCDPSRDDDSRSLVHG